MWEMWVLSLGQKDPLEKGMAVHSSILVWRILWTEEPGRLRSMGGSTLQPGLPFCKAWLTRPLHTQYLQTSPAPPPPSLYHYPAVLPWWNECLPPAVCQSPPHSAGGPVQQLLSPKCVCAPELSVMLLCPLHNALSSCQ